MGYLVGKSININTEVPILCKEIPNKIVIALLDPSRVFISSQCHMSVSQSVKGEWSVAERTTFMKYICNERS